MSFPTNPSIGNTYSIDQKFWVWNGYAWERYDPTPNEVYTINGITGDIGLSAGAGISLAATGKTFTVSLIVGGITGSIQYKDGGGLSGNSQLYFDGTNLVMVYPTHLDGDILGGIHHYAHNNSGVGITKGWPVYITGMDGSSTIFRIAGADASNSSKMPAVGLAESTIANGDFGHVLMFGTLLQVDTSAYATNQTLYVSPGGGLTGIRPTGSGNLIQNIGKVGRVHSNTGSLIVMGPGRSNDVPNIVDVRSWLLMPNGQTATSIVTTFNGLCGNVTGVSSITGVTGILVSGYTGNITISNTGVLTVNGLTGNVTISSSFGPTGPTGPTGSQGIQGPTGPTGEIPTNYVISLNGVTGAITGISAATAVITNINNAATWYPTFVGGTGTTAFYVDAVTTPLSYQPSSGTINARTFNGTFSSNTAKLDAATPLIFIQDAISSVSVDPYSLLQNGASTFLIGGSGITLESSFGIEFTDNVATPTWAYVFPKANGSNGQVLTTNGAGTLSWTAISSSGLTAYVSSFNGNTGAVQGVSVAVAGTGISVSGATGSVTITNTGVLSFNGSTGAVTGVSSFNGSTGAVTGVSSVNGLTGAVKIGRSISVYAPTTTDNITMFYTTNALTLSNIESVIRGAGTGVTFSVRYGTDRSASGTEVVTNGINCSNTTNGLSTTSFNNGTISASSFVWMTIAGVSGSPSELSVTLEF